MPILIDQHPCAHVRSPMDMMPQGWTMSFFPGVATVIEDVGVGFEDPVAEPVVVEELPQVLDRAEFGRARRRGQKGDVVQHGQFPGGVRAGLIEQKYGLSTGSDGRGDLVEVVGHG